MLKVNIGKGIELSVDTDKLGLPPIAAMSSVAQHVVYMGLRNVLMDAHASIKSDEDDYVARSRARSETKLAALYAGDVRVAGTREGDPVRAEAKKLAIKHVIARIKAIDPSTGHSNKPADYKRKDIVAKAMSIIERFMDTARENIANAKAVVVDDGDLDLDGLV